MNIYKIYNDEFIKIDGDNGWYSPDEQYFVTCEGHEMPFLVPIFDFDPSTVQECMSVDQYIRFQSFDGYDFTTFNFIIGRGTDVKTCEINIYSSKNYLILVYDASLEAFNELEQGVVNKRHNILLKKENMLNKIYYLIFDRTIVSYFETLEEMEAMIEEIENNIMTNVSRNNLARILEIKNKVSLIRKNINPMVYIGDALLINDNNIINKSMMKYFTTLDLRINKLNDFSNNLRNLINEARNLYDSRISSKTNDKATLITIIAAFFAPPTVVAGIYGMNFHHMPELQWWYGYPFAIFLMFLTSGLMYAFLKYKKWL